MRATPWLFAEPYRVAALPMYESRYGDDFGAFMIPHPPTGTTLKVMAASGQGGRTEFGDGYAWDHVSVSCRNRCPNWFEMSFVKAAFWADDEVVMQLHVAAKDHLNLHPYVLHLWKPLLLPIPLPPSEMVAVPGDLEANRTYRDKIIREGPAT